MAQSKSKYVLTELMHHLPFSTFGVMMAMLAMGFLTFIAQVAGHGEHMAHAAEDLYHVFHPSHILLSAVATTAMFAKHDGSVLKAVVVGFVGAVGLCTFSDVIFPYFGGKFLGAQMHLHIDLIDHPHIIIPFAVVGTLAGLAAPKSFEKATEYSHSMHVFVSSVASILYLIAFGLDGWMHMVGGVFVVTIFAVMLPCCLGDIVFPLCCSHAKCHHKDVTEMHHH